jgi:hypothetical protein
MKLIKTLPLILVISVIIFSCKDKEDAGPDFSKVSLSLSANAELFTVPAAMATSEDFFAGIANDYMDFAENIVQHRLQLLAIPSGGKESSMPAITAVNARSQAKLFVVYTSKEPSTFQNIAYQIKDTGTKYTFEYLVNDVSQPDWYRYVYAEEAKDLSTGSIDGYGNSDDQRGIIEEYDWTRNGDDFTMDIDNRVNFHGPHFKMHITLNTKTHAGSLGFSQDGHQLYDFTWDAEGSGTYKIYEDGVVTGSGTW